MFGRREKLYAYWNSVTLLKHRRDTFHLVVFNVIQGPWTFCSASNYPSYHMSACGEGRGVSKAGQATTAGQKWQYEVGTKCIMMNEWLCLTATSCWNTDIASKARNGELPNPFASVLAFCLLCIRHGNNY